MLAKWIENFQIFGTKACQIFILFYLLNTKMLALKASRINKNLKSVCMREGERENWIGKI